MCSDENETRLPLLEKAYDKARGEYSVIESGYTEEAAEDLTGGVTSRSGWTGSCLRRPTAISLLIWKEQGEEGEEGKGEG